MKKHTLRFKAYAIIERAVEEGVRIGWRRAHKHTPRPTDEAAVEAIAREVMLALEEVLHFDDPCDEST